ncbi:SCAN domain-containing protein 3-like [Cryptotermes secundus]|uniref:SCAN domain-containing protein 3-like n=1 Tax=Cryptotermes secundus TaxID=105785 RepID=UPI000CD7B9E8|nr:SCAN domain-containing protein 3-like [Cryptotermes secundus]
MEMEMQQIMELLLAMREDRKADEAKAEARHKELMADWKAWGEERRTTHEKIEPHPEAMQSVLEHREVPMTSTRKRIYQEEFLNYGFTQIEDKGIMKPQCVDCLKVLTAESFKKSQSKKHLNNLHPHLSSKPQEYLVNLEMSVKKQRLNSNLRSTFDQCSASKAGFEVAWLIAQKKKPHTIAEDVREQVISATKESKCFAIQLDETTDVSSNSQLMVYVRYKGLNAIEEELLFCSPLELQSRGIDVFNKINEYFNNANLKWEDCIALSVDGAPAMLGHVSGFLALVREKNPKIEVNHCMVHRQALFVKRLEPALEAIMHDVINVVNVVKGHALNTRLFRELCTDGEAEYTDLLYHTEVRWLSRGNVLNRVWVLKTNLKFLWLIKSMFSQISLQTPRGLHISHI